MSHSVGTLIVLLRFPRCFWGLENVRFPIVGSHLSQSHLKNALLEMT